MWHTRQGCRDRPQGQTALGYETSPFVFLVLWKDSQRFPRKCSNEPQVSTVILTVLHMGRWTCVNCVKSSSPIFLVKPTSKQYKTQKAASKRLATRAFQPDVNLGISRTILAEIPMNQIESQKGNALKGQAPSFSICKARVGNFQPHGLNFSYP